MSDVEGVLGKDKKTDTIKKYNGFIILLAPPVVRSCITTKQNYEFSFYSG